MTMNRLSMKQRGFSLIEILISVLVFGIGILGLGGLQIASLKGSNNAHYRTTASVLAMDLADRMRSNLNAVSDGRYGEAVSCSTVSRLCRSSACSIEELAIFDIQEVMCGSKRGTKREGGVAGLLPNGAMTISCVGGCDQPKAVHDITVSWDKSKTDHRSTLDQEQSLTISLIP
jgi:type IV pilus assembly protein PilV